LIHNYYLLFVGVAYSLQNPSNVQKYLQLSKTVKTFHYNNNNNNIDNTINEHILEIFPPLSSTTATTTTTANSHKDSEDSTESAPIIRSNVVVFVHGGAWGSGTIIIRMIMII